MTYRVVLETANETRTLCFDDKETAMNVFNTISAAMDIPRGEEFELCVERPYAWKPICGMAIVNE